MTAALPVPAGPRGPAQPAQPGLATARPADPALLALLGLLGASSDAASLFDVVLKMTLANGAPPAEPAPVGERDQQADGGETPTDTAGDDAAPGLDTAVFPALVLSMGAAPRALSSTGSGGEALASAHDTATTPRTPLQPAFVAAQPLRADAGTPTAAFPAEGLASPVPGAAHGQPAVDPAAVQPLHPVGDPVAAHSTPAVASTATGQPDAALAESVPAAPGAPAVAESAATGVVGTAATDAARAVRPVDATRREAPLADDAGADSPTTTPGSTPNGAAVVTTPTAGAEAPPGGSGLSREVARTVPAQVLPFLDRLPPGGSSLVLQLDPPMLGSIVLRMVLVEGRRVRLHFQVEDASVGEALAAGWTDLAEALHARGLSPEGFAVDLRSDLQAGLPDGAQSRGQRGEHQPDASPAPGRTMSPGHGAVTRHGPAASGAPNGRYIDYVL